MLTKGLKQKSIEHHAVQEWFATKLGRRINVITGVLEPGMEATMTHDPILAENQKTLPDLWVLFHTVKDGAGDEAGHYSLIYHEARQ